MDVEGREFFQMAGEDVAKVCTSAADEETAAGCCRYRHDTTALSSSLSNLTRAFLVCRPSTEIADTIEMLLADGVDDATLVNTVFRNAIARAYPPHRDYRLSVLKAVISRLENHTEIGDGFYDELSRTLAEVAADGFVTYTLADCHSADESSPIHVTLRETRCFASQGTTGLKSWPASKVLTEVLLESVQLEGRCIVELGSGVGLTGLCVLKARPLLKSFTFTDCHPAVLRSLEEHIQINLGGNDDRARVQLLDWSVGGEIPGCDLIVGADIVFDKDIIVPLVNLIVDLLNKGDSRKAIIASVIRNTDTYTSFKTALEKTCQVDSIKLDRFKHFEEVTDDFEVLEIIKKIVS